MRGAAAATLALTLPRAVPEVTLGDENVELYSAP
jgi:hypothetical protein